MFTVKSIPCFLSYCQPEGVSSTTGTFISQELFFRVSFSILLYKGHITTKVKMSFCCISDDYNVYIDFIILHLLQTCNLKIKLNN